MIYKELTRRRAQEWVNIHSDNYKTLIIGGPNDEDHVSLLASSYSTGNIWIIDRTGIVNDAEYWPWVQIEDHPAMTPPDPDFSLEEMEKAENILASLS